MKNTLKYSLHLQKNPIHPDEPEKAYARLQLNGVLDINALAAHMSNHNSIYSKGTIVGIITDMCHCVKEAITEGNAVMLGDLGRFTPSPLFKHHRIQIVHFHTQNLLSHAKSTFRRRI